ncbi:amidohydrolase [Candidatus Poribacteria bacterium]|nr:amidohydrolase [Candidatus Poribacteria bacterium]
MTALIVDTHTHFYDPTRPQGVPWPPKDDAVLYRTVLPEHLRALAEPLGIAGTVVVEASPWRDDNDWILSLAAVESYIVGFIGNLDITGTEVLDDLARLGANPMFRGLRIGSAALHRAMDDGSFRVFAALADQDLTLDLLAGADDLPAVRRLAAAFPRLRMVLDHIAHVRVDGQAPNPGWRDGIERLSDTPNVFCKVSGMVEATGLSPAPSDPGFYAPTLDVLRGSFGDGRLVFGSNWPVCERFASYATVLRIPEQYFSTCGATEQVFSLTHVAAYGRRA